MTYQHQVTGLADVTSTKIIDLPKGTGKSFNYAYHHDAHMANWLKATFNLTVQDHEFYFNKNDWWMVFKGDYDYDIKVATAGPSIFDAALEYSAMYDEALNDKLVALEMGTERVQLPNDYMEKAK